MWTEAVPALPAPEPRPPAAARLGSAFDAQQGHGNRPVSRAPRLDDEATSERAWLACTQRSISPMARRNFTEQEARDFLAKEGVRASQDEDRGEVHTRRERSDPGAHLHEGLHLFSSSRWRTRMGYNVNEGVTSPSPDRSAGPYRGPVTPAEGWQSGRMRRS